MQVIAREQQVNDSTTIRGLLVDTHTRCSHYHSDLDIIALKFKCCPKTYYPCFQCHEQVSNHAIEKFEAGSGENTVLCGDCLLEMTAQQYMNSGSCCPSCHGRFNPRCSLHYSLYFAM